MNQTMTRQSNSKKKPNPFLMAGLGILMFIGSFPVLFLNETQENLASITKEAVEYSEAIENNTLAYAIGSMDVNDPASDLFIDQEFLTISRTVEMYGYQETQTTTNGVDSYSYTKAWVLGANPTSEWLGTVSERPSDLPQAYDTWVANAPVKQTAISTGLSIQGVPVNYEFLYYTGYETFVPSAQQITDNRYTLQGDYVYYSVQGNGTLSEPQVGDVRLSFSVIELSQEGVLLGEYTDLQWNRYTTENGNTLFRFFAGETSITNVISILQAEYEMFIWIIRLIGFVMMFIGLLLAFKPLTSLFKFVPLFGDVGTFVLTIGLFVVSLVLSTLTILISLLLQNIFLLVGVIILLLVGGVLVLQKRSLKITNK